MRTNPKTLNTGLRVQAGAREHCGGVSNGQWWKDIGTSVMDEVTLLPKNA